MLSLWEQAEFSSCDFAIIGAGIIGLSTAIELRIRHPDARIVVLESGVFPSGATTRNAGFATFGSAHEILSDISSMGIKEALDRVSERYQGLVKLKERWENVDIGLRSIGGYDVLCEEDLWVLKDLESLNDILGDILPNKRVFSIANKSRFGFGPKVGAMVYNPMEGQLDSGKLYKAMLSYVRSLDIQVWFGASVRELSSTELRFDRIREPSIVESSLRVDGGVVLAANSAISEFFPHTNIVPGRGQMVMTSVINDLPWRGTFHIHEGYDYFRSVETSDGIRVILGGGRNLNKDGEETRVWQQTNQINQHLEKLLRETILPDQQFSIAGSWQGTMGFTAGKRPFIQEVSPNVVVAFACNGMGVALGSLAGERAAAFFD